MSNKVWIYYILHSHGHLDEAVKGARELKNYPHFALQNLCWPGRQSKIGKHNKADYKIVFFPSAEHLWSNSNVANVSCCKFQTSLQGWMNVIWPPPPGMVFVCVAFIRIYSHHLNISSFFTEAAAAAAAAAAPVKRKKGMNECLSH